MLKGFKSFELKYRYRSGSEDALPKQFYELVMPSSRNYYRAVGFFTSRCFIEITHGINEFVKNNGKIYLITSPKLNEEDYNAIEKGYKAREDIYLDAFKRELIMPETLDDANRLIFLANLIENGILEIKIAITNRNNSSMYHEKIGIFEDIFGDKIVISGSNNESENAITSNFESFDVFSSWNDCERVKIRCSDFKNMWENKQNGLDVFSFPAFNKLFTNKYKQDVIKQKITTIPKYSTFDKPSQLELYDYQVNAIKAWQDNDYIGIYDMATGTGKTFTALASIDLLYKNIEGDFCVIILCPYIHLVTQWVEDIKKFKCEPIIGFGSSPQKEWKEKLSRKISTRNRKNKAEGFFCFITTVATFRSSYIQGQIAKIRKPILLVADEAHNLGSQNTEKYLIEERYKYRLALSATLERHWDEAGTKKLYNFFGEKCIEYGLEEAINENHLVPYKYYPILVYFDEEEREEYLDITKAIGKEITIDKKTKKQKLSEYGKMLCINRSRIIAGCHQKVPTLMEIIEPYKNDNMILIYCGAVKFDEDFYTNDDDEIANKQIDEVIRRLVNTYSMNICRFTAGVNIKDREIIKSKFSEGKDLQAIAAIKCLDEGVNIPSIKTAFILASSTNPKEYIQRRGRVLRKFSGKDFAEIYDFITLPFDINTANNKTEEELQSFKTLAKNELERIKEFSRLAMNSYDSYDLLERIPMLYHLNNNNYMEDFNYE